MPDPESPPATPATPAAQPASAPPAEPPKPAAPSAQYAPSDAFIKITNPDGSTRIGRVADLIAENQRLAESAVPEDKRKKWELLDRVEKGDTEAIKELFGVTEADPAPGRTDPAATEARMAQLERELGQIKPMHERLRQMSRQANLLNTITGHAEQLPVLAALAAKDPSVLDEIIRSADTVAEGIRASGRDPNKMSPDEAARVQAQVLLQAENRWTRMRDILGPVAPTTNAPARPAVQDDQTREAQPGVRDSVTVTPAPGFQQPAPAGTVDSHIPSPAAGGSLPGMTQPDPNAPIDRETFLAGMRGSLATMGADS